MDFGLKHKIALVTGASHGVGRAIAIELAREGADVVLFARNFEALREVRHILLNTFRVKGYIACGDATSEKDVLLLFNEVVHGLGRLDILVNNVGGAETFGDFFSLSDEDWLKCFELNCLSAVRFSRRAIPYLRASRCPRIINISAANSKEPGKSNPHYVVAKAGLNALGKCLANELARDGILVNTVCPSTLHGGGWERNVRDRAVRDAISEEEAEKRMFAEESKKTPLGRIGTPEDVARFVAFLASPMNGYMTGACMSIDGGIARSI